MERQARPLDNGRPELARQEGLLRLMAASPRLQRQCACGAPSAAGGSCAACEAKTPLQGLQRKTLAIGAADDPLEREADQVAERVMRMEVPASVAEHIAHGDAGTAHAGLAETHGGVDTDALKKIQPATIGDAHRVTQTAVAMNSRCLGCGDNHSRQRREKRSSDWGGLIKALLRPILHLLGDQPQPTTNKKHTNQFQG